MNRSLDQNRSLLRPISLSEKPTINLSVYSLLQVLSLALYFPCRTNRIGSLIWYNKFKTNEIDNPSIAKRYSLFCVFTFRNVFSILLININKHLHVYCPFPLLHVMPNGHYRDKLIKTFSFIACRLIIHNFKHDNVNRNCTTFKTKIIAT